MKINKMNKVFTKQEANDIITNHTWRTYELKPKQRTWLRWYRIARMDKLIAESDVLTDYALDEIILSNEYSHPYQSYLNSLRSEYRLSKLKQMVEDNLKL